MPDKFYMLALDVLLAVLFILGSILLINLLEFFTANYEPDCSAMQPVLKITPLFFIQHPLIFKIAESSLWIISLLFPVVFYFISAVRSKTGDYRSWEKILPFIRVVILILLTILYFMAGALLADITLALPFIAIYVSLLLLYIFLFKKEITELIIILKANLYFKILIILIILIYYLAYLYNLMWFTSISFPCMGELPQIGS